MSENHDCQQEYETDDDAIYVTECDNSCGTFYCVICGKEYYYEKGTKELKKGHNPSCGDESSSDDVYRPPIRPLEPLFY